MKTKIHATPHQRYPWLVECDCGAQFHAPNEPLAELWASRHKDVHASAFATTVGLLESPGRCCE